MNQVDIPVFGIKTTQLGFGCSSLLGLQSERESRRLIDAAYDAGTRHFDVARSYGHGAAERLLGRTLGSRRANVTITTKFGLPVPKNQALVRTVRSLARPLVKRLSGMRARSKTVLSAIASTVDFTPQEANRLLTTSLKELQTSYVDLFLLHEVREDLLADDRLLDFLHEAMREGKIKGHGVGSDLAVLPSLIERHPEYCPVVQHECSALTKDVVIPKQSFRICHGALLRSFDAIQREFEKDPKSASDAIGIDMADAGNLSALLLRTAVVKYPGSITLFSARSAERIRNNVTSLTNSQLDPYCAKLTEYLKG